MIEKPAGMGEIVAAPVETPGWDVMWELMADGVYRYSAASLAVPRYGVRGYLTRETIENAAIPVGEFLVDYWNSKRMVDIGRDGVV